MNVLLIFFALPIATIIISIALQKILKCPPLVAAIIFAIFLIVTFTINNINFLVATIVYTIISFVTAVIVCLIYRLIQRFSDNDNDGSERRRCNCNSCRCGCEENNNNSNDLLTISSNCGNLQNGNLLTISSNCGNGNNNCRCDDDNSICGCNNQNNDNRISARINVIPNSNGNGTGQICGCYRRR